MTRGSLPPAVYWRRRVFMLGLVLALVLMGSSLVGSDEPAGTDESTPTAQQASSSSEVPVSGEIYGPQLTDQNTKQKSIPLPEPSGECADVDVKVEPRVLDDVAGADVRIRLRLSKRTPGACYWNASAETLAVKIVDGEEMLWQLRDCPRALTRTQVSVYGPRTSGAPTSSARMVWQNTERSDAECSGLAGWVTSGSYSVVGAALGGEPETTAFDLQAPRGRVIRTPVEKSPQVHEFAPNP